MVCWFDTHVHLEMYPADARERMLRDAAAAGVERVLAVSTDCDSSRRTVALGEGALKAVGVHPTRASDGVCEALGELAGTPGVVAIGETGFDGSGPEWGLQEAAFRQQADLARSSGLALVLHVDSEGAWDQLVAASEALDGLSVVRHYFQGDLPQVRWHAERGHFVSFGRPLLRNEQLRAVAREAPADLLLIETDSYPLPGRTTEPRDLVEVAAALAEVRGWSMGECGEQLWENSCRAFGLSL